jgi:hypothetical protein
MYLYMFYALFTFIHRYMHRLQKRLHYSALLSLIYHLFSIFINTPGDLSPVSMVSMVPPQGGGLGRVEPVPKNPSPPKPVGLSVISVANSFWDSVYQVFQSISGNESIEDTFQKIITLSEIVDSFYNNHQGELFCTYIFCVFVYIYIYIFIYIFECVCIYIYINI